MLWDTAGQEEFDAITRAYYRGAQACVVAFSSTDRASFLAVKRWKKKVCMLSSPDLLKGISKLRVKEETNEQERVKERSGRASAKLH